MTEKDRYEMETQNRCRTSPATDRSRGGEKQVQLPATLAQRIDHRLARTEFQSRDEYVIYALEQLLAQIEDNDEDEATKPKREDVEGVEERLQSLGYL